ncbi:MAG: tetratricopeptide repeat protein [Tidjanibacter sp.]|nr:tetratricopeptide repeat protein [Tidjanibacter sp.]
MKTINKIKKIFKRATLMLAALLMVALQPAVAQPTSVETLWERGNTLYAAGDYNGALAVYDSIQKEGWASAKLFYNMGNAYFKGGQLGEAILHYHKAQKLAPADDDVAYNLAYANSFVKDKIEVVPEFFLKVWFSKVGNLMSSNAWAVCSLVALALTLIAGLVYVLGAKRSVRKGGFVVGIVCGVLTLVMVAFGGAERRDVLDCSEAVVVSSAAAVKSSPDRTSKDIFILHEGTTVKVLDTFGAWNEIRIADGNEGWIASSAIRVVD